MNYWLVKSEPGAYSIDDLARDKTTDWSGVRNYQARNFMRDQMQAGDQVLFYHSNTDPLAIVGLAEVSSAPYADATAFDPQSHYFDPQSDPTKPTWILVDLTFKQKFKHPVTLETIKNDPELQTMLVAQRGMRLSVQPVDATHFKRIVSLGN